MSHLPSIPPQDTERAALPAPWDRVFAVASRLFVWGLLAALLYVLRGFFLLIFLTFVFAYIQANGVKRLEPHVRSRTRRVILVSSLFVSVLIAVTLYLTPRVIQQAESFFGQFTVYTQRIDQEILGLAARNEYVGQLVQELLDSEDSAKHGKPSPTAFLLRSLTGVGEEGGSTPTQKIEQLISSMRHAGVMLAAFGSAFFLSLLFSFLIVLDLPKLSASVRGLRHTKLGFIYDEVADSIYQFGRVLGEAFEAQFLIALVNTALTTLGLFALGLGEHVAFLSVIVFLFSFVPVAGVFISSIPICLIALQVSGVTTMFIAIGLIVVIHMIEGYILNPRIYGQRMKINPVIVLIILTIGGKLFHFWGLLLGVPVATYIFRYAIRRPDSPGDELPATSDAPRAAPLVGAGIHPSAAHRDQGM